MNDDSRIIDVKGREDFALALEVMAGNALLGCDHAAYKIMYVAAMQMRDVPAGESAKIARQLDQAFKPIPKTYEYTHENCPGPHKIIADWTKISPYTVPDNIESDGGCADGCCDDFRCKGCGYWFRVECPQ